VKETVLGQGPNDIIPENLGINAPDIKTASEMCCGCGGGKEEVESPEIRLPKNYPVLVSRRSIKKEDSVISLGNCP